jgi:TPR repeat protein
MCLYLGRQYATGGTFFRTDVSKDIPQSLFYFDRACQLGSEKGCKAGEGIREITGVQ